MEDYEFLGNYLLTQTFITTISLKRNLSTKIKSQLPCNKNFYRCPKILPLSLPSHASPSKVDRRNRPNLPKQRNSNESLER